MIKISSGSNGKPPSIELVHESKKRKPDANTKLMKELEEIKSPSFHDSKKYSANFSISNEPSFQETDDINIIINKALEKYPQHFKYIKDFYNEFSVYIIAKLISKENDNSYKDAEQNGYTLYSGIFEKQTDRAPVRKEVSVRVKSKDGKVIEILPKNVLGRVKNNKNKA